MTTTEDRRTPLDNATAAVQALIDDGDCSARDLARAALEAARGTRVEPAPLPTREQVLQVAVTAAEDHWAGVRSWECAVAAVTTLHDLGLIAWADSDSEERWEKHRAEMAAVDGPPLLTFAEDGEADAHAT